MSFVELGQNDIKRVLEAGGVTYSEEDAAKAIEAIKNGGRPLHEVLFARFP